MGIITRRKFKLGSYPKPEEFPYKHNYDAMKGGHSEHDIDTGWDKDGVPYKKESEFQRLFQTGPNKWGQASNAKTTNIHKWLNDKKI